MSGKFKIYIIIWIIGIAIFNTAAFVSPIALNAASGGFWVGYIFIMLSFIGQLACSHTALKSENSKKAFYNVSLMVTSFTALFVIVVIGTLCMAVSAISLRFAVTVCIFVTGAAAALVLTVRIAVNNVSNIDAEIHTKTYTIKTLTAEAEHLVFEANSDEMKSVCKKVYEALRYSDPMSNTALSEINEQIQREFSVFESYVKDDDLESVKSVSSELMNIIDKRNVRCRRLK